MSSLSIPNAISNGIAADGNDVGANFTAIQTWADNDVVEVGQVDHFLPPGMLAPFAGSATPTGWLLADGSAVSRVTYAALFAVVGTTYGAGDGVTTFNLPNLKGTMPVGRDSGQTEFDTLGETGGYKETTLASSNLPPHFHSMDHNHGSVSTSTNGSHTHTEGADIAARGTTGFVIYEDQASGPNAWDSSATGTIGARISYATASGGSHSHTVDFGNYSGNTGAYGPNTAFTNMPPYLVINYIVKT